MNIWEKIKAAVLKNPETTIIGGIAAVLLIVAEILHSQGMISEETIAWIRTLVMGGGVFGVGALSRVGYRSSQDTGIRPEK